MSYASDNPLQHSSFDIPFDRISPEHVRPAIKALLAEAEAALVAIENDDAPPSYSNTLESLDEATVALSTAMSIVGHLESVVNTPALREAYNEVQPEVSAFYAGIPLRAKLWDRVQIFANTPEANALKGPLARHLQLTLNDFRRSGAELGNAGKERLQQISRELAELTSKFSQNVLDETGDFELVLEDKAQLAGLPESAIAAARADAEAKDKQGWRFSLHAPSLIPLLTYLDAREIRKQVWCAYNTRASRGSRNNVPLTKQILLLRSEQAKLLGYDEFAAMVLEERMAKTTATAVNFVEDLRQRGESFFAKEKATLEAFAEQYTASLQGARSSDTAQAITLQPWDISYYSEKQRKALYDFDEELLRPYFPIKAVMRGLFTTAKRLYDVNITPNTSLSTWHQDAAAFDIHNNKGERIASFYADLHPRENKRGGAWMNHFISGLADRNDSGRTTPHLGLICANVTPPVGDTPAMLTHSEVETMFHEFGHLLHHCLSRVSVRSLVGTNVPWDFVELPSQLMENWCWEKEALDTFARHYKTDETIPNELFEKLARARTYRTATAMMRQLGFASVDMALHVRFDPKGDVDLLTFAREVLQEFSPAPYPDDYGMLVSFTHLFSSAVGYAAGYYSYKWAEVLDADAFTRFKKEGIYNTDTGKAFLSSILERGNTEDPAELYKRFMGRAPSLDALLERDGLTAQSTAQ